MKPASYASRSAKVLDFVIGFFGVIVLVVMGSGVEGVMGSDVGLIIGVGIAVVTVVVAFVIRRHYLAIGVLTVPALLLLTLGACAMLFKGL